MITTIGAGTGATTGAATGATMGATTGATNGVAAGLPGLRLLLRLPPPPSPLLSMPSPRLGSESLKMELPRRMLPRRAPLPASQEGKAKRKETKWMRVNFILNVFEISACMFFVKQFIVR
jgi:hypothetical protein